MWTFITGWFSTNALRLIGWGVAALSVMAVLLGARQAGRNAERVDQLKKSLEVKDAQLRATLDAPAIAASLLTACATANSNPACGCPPIRQYDREFQRRLADEIKAAPANAAFPVALQDYTMLRNQIRKCR
jgi:hypothetical protein